MNVSGVSVSGVSDPHVPFPHTAIVPAAGLGTRFLPATKTVPKELLPVVDTPGIELVAAERRASQEWLHRRLASLNPDERATLLRAADLMSAIVDESA